MTNLLDDLTLCGEALRDPAGPARLYQAIADAVGRHIGHKLFTLLVVVEGGTMVERIWSSNEPAYPLTGRKPMGPTPWGKHVIEGRQPWLGNDDAAIRWAFPDHALIASLGLGACINVPVIAFGRVLGTMNILDRAGAYKDAHVATARMFEPFLMLPFAEAAARIAKGS